MNKTIEDQTRAGKFPGVKPKRDELEPEVVPMYHYREDSESIKES